MRSSADLHCARTFTAGQCNRRSAPRIAQGMTPTPKRRDIIVIGGSAGAIEALRALVAHLPADLAASIFVTIHIPADFPSILPSLLRSAGPLPAVHPADKKRTRPGMIYVAP